MFTIEKNISLLRYKIASGSNNIKDSLASSAYSALLTQISQLFSYLAITVLSVSLPAALNLTSRSVGVGYRYNLINRMKVKYLVL